MAPRFCSTSCLIGALLLLPAPCLAAGGDEDGGRSCAVGFAAGPRAGGTLNFDQWIAGGHGRLSLLCLGGFGSELVTVAGFGGNHLTLRGSARLTQELELWGGPRGVRLYPALGWSLVYFVPVGHFGEWCDRYDVDACSGLVNGLELGGGLRVSWFGLEAIVGFAELPVVTLSATATFDLVGSRPR